jgi:hypothetical protein
MKWRRAYIGIAAAVVVLGFIGLDALHTYIKYDVLHHYGGVMRRESFFPSGMIFALLLLQMWWEGEDELDHWLVPILALLGVIASIMLVIVRYRQFGRF